MEEVTFGMNQYCGPSVLSILTGLDTDTCAEKITEVTGKIHVTAVHPQDLIKAGEKIGLKFELNDAFTNRSLFWTASALVNFEGMYLITIPNHYITIEVKDRQIQICDNHTKQPMDLQNSARLSQKVEKVWKVKKVFDYIKPQVVFDDVYIFKDYNLGIRFERHTTYLDGKIKRHILGSILTDNIDIIRQVADKLFKLREI